MKKRPMSSMHSDSGFTLMEIMVAVLILAISLTVILQLFSAGLKSERLSEEYTQALSCGRSIMEELLLANQLSEETLEGGCEGGFSWKATISQLFPEESTAKRAGPISLRPFRIDLEVFWPVGRGGKRFTLNTVHLAQPVTTALPVLVGQP